MSATVTKLKPEAVNRIASLDLPPHVIHLAAFVSKDAARVSLSNLRIEPINASKARAIATNGHLLATTEFDLAIGADFINDSIHIPLTSLKALKVGKNETAHVEVSEGAKFPDYSVTYSVGARSVTETYGSHQFPQWEQVMPKQPVKDAVKRIGLDAAYIGEIGAYAKRCGLRSQGATFIMPQDDLSPVTILIDNPEFTTTFILMPIRL